MPDIVALYNELKLSRPDLTLEKVNVLADKYMHLRLIDDDLMRVAFRDNIEAVQTLIRPIIGNNTLKVKSSVIQDDIQLYVGTKAVKLDIVAYDDEGKVYNIEFQRDIAHANPERARYHCSMLDSKHLSKGSTTRSLPECYVIFITERDYFGRGQQIYHIDRIINETEEPFVDKQHIIYLNCEKEDESELGKLIHDLLCSESDDMHSRVLAEASDGAKGYGDLTMYITGICDNEEQLLAQGQAIGFEVGKAAGLEEGFESGKAEGKTQAIAELSLHMAQLGKSPDEIATLLGISVEQVKDILE